MRFDDLRTGMGGGHGKGRRRPDRTPRVGCPKHGYRSRAEAAAAAAQSRRHDRSAAGDHPISAYHCVRCHCWHIGHRPFWRDARPCPSSGRHALCDLPHNHDGMHGGLGAGGQYYVWA